MISVKPLVLLPLFLAFQPLAAEKIGPWDIDALKNNVPTMKWVQQDKPVHALMYAGEVYQGHPTQVFAFYASPTTVGDVAAGTKTFPGVVLIHGGGGTAFADWAYLWAKRGYAAIAMDLAGSRPPDPVFDPKTGAPVGHQADAKVRARLPDGGPPQGSTEKFASIAGPVSEQWPFHAVASAMRAHTLLRSFKEVEADHTAVTGISWGGYTTCIVASVDDRFKAAVPVYGCGFLHEGESVQKPQIDGLGEHREKWVTTYDPGGFLPRCHVPIFFVNGSNDVHYVLDSYMKSYNAVPGEKSMRIELNMRHGHPPGWAPKEIGLFIDSKCRAATPLPVPGIPMMKDNQIEVACPSTTKLKSASLYYTTETGVRSSRRWISVPATLSGDTITASAPPKEANTWFLTVTDERDAMVSTVVQFSK